MSNCPWKHVRQKTFHPVPLYIQRHDFSVIHQSHHSLYDSLDVKKMFEVVIYKTTNVQTRYAAVMNLQKMNKADFHAIQKVQKML